MSAFTEALKEKMKTDLQFARTVFKAYHELYSPVIRALLRQQKEG